MEAPKRKATMYQRVDLKGYPLHVTDLKRDPVFKRTSIWSFVKKRPYLVGCALFGAWLGVDE